MRRIITLALVFLATNLCFGVGRQGQRYALLVGVDEYDQANFIHALGAAGADAEDLGKTLVDVSGFPKDNVRVLTSHSGNKPTNTNILFELEQLGKSVKAGDTVFFFFSGHGIEIGGSTYLLPSNTDARSELTLKQSAIPTSLIQSALSRLPAENLVLAFDMCRTDPLKSDRAADPRADRVSEKQVKDLVMVPASGDGPGPKQVVTFFSCSPGQKSYEWRNQNRGYFSYYFEQALRGQAADPKTGEVRVGDLQTFVMAKVAAEVKRNENSDQVPYIKQEGPDPGHMTLAWGKPGTKPTTETGGAVKEESTIATMRFTVLGPDGKPIADPTITLDGKAIGTESTLDLEDQKTRNVEVTVKADGFKVKVLQVTLERGKITPVEVKLEAKPTEKPIEKPIEPPSTEPGNDTIGFILTRSAHNGESAKYQGRVEGTVNSLPFTFTWNHTDTVKEVSSDGSYAVEEAQSDAKIEVGGNVTPVEGSRQTTRYEANGKVKSVNSTDPNDIRVSSLSSVEVPSKRLKVGDTWTIHVKGDSSGAVEANKVFRVEGHELIGDFDTLRLHASIKETTGSAPASLEATIWVSVKDGSMVKLDGAWVNMPIANLEPISVKMTVTRQG